MGQRLVLNIVKDEKIIANAYYHWSGYSIPALMIAHCTMENLEILLEKPHKQSLGEYKKMAVKALSRTGAKANSSIYHRYKLGSYVDHAWHYDDSRYSLVRNRNDGLIDVDERAIDNNLDWAEMIATIVICDDDSVMIDPPDLLFYTLDEDDDDDKEYLNDYEMDSIPDLGKQHAYEEMGVTSLGVFIGNLLEVSEGGIVKIDGAYHEVSN